MGHPITDDSWYEFSRLEPLYARWPPARSSSNRFKPEGSGQSASLLCWTNEDRQKTKCNCNSHIQQCHCHCANMKKKMLIRLNSLLAKLHRLTLFPKLGKLQLLERHRTKISNLYQWVKIVCYSTLSDSL